MSGERVPDLRGRGREGAASGRFKRCRRNNKKPFRRRTKCPRWLVQREGARKVDWERVVKEAEGKNCKFKLNAERDRKPVKFLKEWSDMVALAFFHDETGSTVLNTLKTRKLLRRDARKRGVTIVKTRGDRSMNESSSRFGRKKGANRRDAS